MSKETNRVLGHADESDGIEEYDNPLPDWWVGLLWFTVIWAVAYGVHYHFIGNRSQEGHLAAEMQAAEVRWPVEAAAAVSFAITPEAVAAGEAVYTQNCAMCHGAELEGVSVLRSTTTCGFTAAIPKPCSESSQRVYRRRVC